MLRLKKSPVWSGQSFSESSRSPHAGICTLETQENLAFPQHSLCYTPELCFSHIQIFSAVLSLWVFKQVKTQGTCRKAHPFPNCPTGEEFRLPQQTPWQHQSVRGTIHSALLIPPLWSYGCWVNNATRQSWGNHQKVLPERAMVWKI